MLYNLLENEITLILFDKNPMFPYNLYVFRKSVLKKKIMLNLVFNQ